MNKNVFLFFFSIILVLILSEYIVRISGLYTFFNEREDRKYISLFDVEINNHYYRFQEKSTIHHKKNNEFNYKFYVDELGFRNSSKKLNSNPKIIVFGDSFTEGLGAKENFSTPEQLELILNKMVYNAGVFGSDIVFQQKILEDIMPLNNVNSLYFIINFSDIADIITRGGKERFIEDGSVAYKKPPFFMPLYRISHLFRAIIHNIFRYDYMFNHPFNREENIQKALIIISQTFEEIQDLCDKKNLEMSVFIHPLPQEYYKVLDSRLDFKEIDKLHNLLKNKNIEVYNLREDFEKRLHTKEDWKNHSWEIDGHFNEKGYSLMAKLIYEKISSK